MTVKKDSRETVLSFAPAADRFAADGAVRGALRAMAGREKAALDFARRNRVLPQIFRNVRRRGLQSETPEELLRTSEGASRLAAAHNMLLMETAEELLETAAEHGVELLPFKGLSLLGGIYEPGERVMSDLDFIVRRRDLDGLDSMMVSRGWEREFSGLPREFEEEYSGERKYAAARAGARIDAEFRWEPSPGPALGRAFPLAAETPWRLSFVEGKRRRLTPEGEILMCAHHLAALHSFGRLMWFLDIRYLIERHRENISWPSLWKEFGGAGLERAAACVFSFLEKYMGMEKVPPPHGKGAEGMEKELLDRLLVESLAGGAILKTGVVPGMVADRRLDYFAGYLFPGARYLRLRYPDVPAPLLPFHRAARLAAKAVLGSRSFKYNTAGDDSGE